MHPTPTRYRDKHYFLKIINAYRLMGRDFALVSDSDEMALECFAFVHSYFLVGIAKYGQCMVTSYRAAMV